MNPEQGQENKSCVTCGQTLYGKYCSACGEKVLRKEDKSVLHFFEEFFHGLTHADSKFLKSLKYLITKPGFLTKEHLNGRRKLYTSPLSMFFIGNLLYLLFMPVDALNSHYTIQVKGQVYSPLIEQQGIRKMEERKWTPEQMEEHYNEKSGKISKMLLVLLIFMFSLPVALIFYNKNTYYFDHLVFATEFINYLIYFMFLILPYIFTAIYILIHFLFRITPDFDMNGILPISFLFLIIWSYLWVSARRVYNVKWMLPRSILLLASAIIVVLLYRFLLFQVTMLML